MLLWNAFLKLLLVIKRKDFFRIWLEEREKDIEQIFAAV
jgi:hypothetical protein